jgi:uncharacterized delta-60 repeat protein
MNLIKVLIILLLMLACALLSIACSNGNSPLMPAEENQPGIARDTPESIGAANENRKLLAVYDVFIDPITKAFMITPADRTAQLHVPLTYLYPNVLEITDYGWTPGLWADITLIHPFHGSSIDAFDPRVIAILPANPNVSFVYPVLGVNGNNAVVLEPDGYTKLFDNLGGAIPGNINPFKAYFKDQPNRIWSGRGVPEKTLRWQINIDGFGGEPFQFKLVVDVSSNYPDAPEPVIDNAREPVQIDATVAPGLTTEGGDSEITVTLLDWQGESGIGGVFVEAPDLFNSTVNLSYSGPGPNANEYIYGGLIANSLLASEGEYEILIATFDLNTEIYMYNEFSVNVVDASGDGNLAWVKQAGNVGDDSGIAVTVLSDNSTVMTGYFKGSTTFGSGDPNETILTSTGMAEIFIARYNPDGTLKWAKHAGGLKDDIGGAITSLSDDSTVATGYFQGSATFGPGEINQTVLTSAGNLDIFIARYNPDGTLLWAKRAGGSDHDYNGDEGFGITSLSDDSTVVTGRYCITAEFGSKEASKTNYTILTSAGYQDIFIARYNPDGTLAWAKSAGGTDTDFSYGITSPSDDSVVITGGFGETATFGKGEINETILTSLGRRDIFVAKYNPDGTLAWVKQAGGERASVPNQITALSDNSTVVTGYFDGPVIFGPGEPNETVLTDAGYNDIFIARYNPDGSLAWVKRAGGISNEESQGITALSNDSTVITGVFVDSATFGLGEPNQTVLIASGSDDIFIAWYNPDGTLKRAKRAGGPDHDWGRGIVSLSNDSTVVTGFFEGSATFGPGELGETVLTSAGSWDIYIARFKP